MRFQFIGRGAALNPLEGNNAVMYQEDGNLLLVDMGEKKERVICDYIAGMTDSYAITKFGQLYIPKAWKG